MFSFALVRCFQIWWIMLSKNVSSTFWGPRLRSEGIKWKPGWKIIKHATPLPCIRCNPVYPILCVLLGQPAPISSAYFWACFFPRRAMKLVLPNATVKIKLLTHLSNEEQQSTSTMYHVLCPRRKVDRMLGGTQVELLERLCSCHCF